jgi:error-prone DNA polymerase
MLALTDTNGLYGAIRFVDVARRAGLRPLLGAELTVGEHRALVLAKTPEGYANVCRLLSARHCDASFDFVASIVQHRRGLVICSDDVPALTAWKKQKLQDLYVELTPGAMMHQALAFSRRSGLPPVATNRVHFIRSADFTAHRVLRAIALNTTLSQLPADACCASSHRLMSSSELELHYPHVPHALTNTRRIAESCHTDWNFKDTIFPAFRQFSDAQAFACLQEHTYAGAVWRYGTLSFVVQERVERELAVIREKGFAHCFLVVEEIVWQAPRTCGRGSAAASIVSYCLGITHVDPIRHNLFFERFLNVGRHDPPDIDIDFPWDERDRILDFIFSQYGARRVAMVANQNTLGLRAAIREVAKVYGMSTMELNRLMPQLTRQTRCEPSASDHSVDGWAESLCGVLGMTDPWPEILQVAVRLEGHLQHLGLHCGGVVIVPDDIRRYVPVQISAKGVPVIQWEKDQTEDAGLVKLDILGNRSLAVIRDAIEAVAQNTGCRLDYATWDPLTDPATHALIQRGETIGCFYIESPATRLLLRKLWVGMPVARRAHADIFEYLVIVSSLVRPAANRYIREFVKRAHGAWYPPIHPLLETVLAETHGIMVYQEDVTKVAMALAGFSVEDADQLRKVLSKKHKEHQLADYKLQFYHGARARGLSISKVDAIWGMVMSFVGYSFCKPHSASYAQVSFKSAYLRAHHPAEFMAAVISNQGGFYSTFAYLSEARRMGLTVLSPDINASAWAYTGSGQTVRVGLMQVKGLRRSVVDRIVNDRTAHGPFRSFQDFCDRVSPELAQTRLLIKAGCFDSLAGEVTRPGLLWRLHAQFRSSSDASRFTLHVSRSLPIPDDYSDVQKVQHEIELLGFPLSQHPLELYANCFHGLSFVTACEMPRYVGRDVTMLGWLITIKSAQTKHGESMEFVTFEDLSGLYDATFFPEAYHQFGSLLSGTTPYIVTGRVEEEFSTYTLTVPEIQVPTTRC